MEQSLVMDGDLISRSALLGDFEWLKSVVNESSKTEVEETIQRIRNAAAVDARPVIRGHWIWKGKDRGWFCSECGSGCLLNYESDWHNSKFCPHCGAEMNLPEVKDMDRAEMIEFIKKTPFVGVSHPLFSDGEYVYCSSDGNVYDENGYLFEDWYSEGPGKRAGIRERVGGDWETGWFLKKEL